MRINARGIRFIPLSHTLHVSLQDGVDSLSIQEYLSQEAARQYMLLQEMSLGVENGNNGSLPVLSSLLLGSGHSTTGSGFATNRWKGISCNPARDSLCHLQSSSLDAEYVSRLFPNYPNQVFLTQRDSNLLPSNVAR